MMTILGPYVLHEPSPPDCAARPAMEPWDPTPRRRGTSGRPRRPIGHWPRRNRRSANIRWLRRRRRYPVLLESGAPRADGPQCPRPSVTETPKWRVRPGLLSSGEPAKLKQASSRPQHALGMTVMPDALKPGSCHGPVAAMMRSRPGPSCQSGPPTLGRIVEPSRILWSTNRRQLIGWSADIGAAKDSAPPNPWRIEPRPNGHHNPSCSPVCRQIRSGSAVPSAGWCRARSRNTWARCRGPRGSAKRVSAQRHPADSTSPTTPPGARVRPL